MWVWAVHGIWMGEENSSSQVYLNGNNKFGFKWWIYKHSSQKWLLFRFLKLWNSIRKPNFVRKCNINNLNADVDFIFQWWRTIQNSIYQKLKKKHLFIFQDSTNLALQTIKFPHLFQYGVSYDSAFDEWLPHWIIWKIQIKWNLSVIIPLFVAILFFVIGYIFPLWMSEWEMKLSSKAKQKAAIEYFVAQNRLNAIWISHNVNPCKCNEILGRFSFCRLVGHPVHPFRLMLFVLN